MINEGIRDLFGYLADGIIPNSALFVKNISEASNDKEKCFSAAQDAIRKNMERAFGVLVMRFKIVKELYWL